jgi:protein-tyrosine phosphatase
MKVLFVCMGNICRSPTVEGVFRQMLLEHVGLSHVEADSAGTHAYHVGEPPDPRSVAAAKRRGYDLSPLRARAISDSDFEVFDLVLAMDQSNLDILLQQSPAGQHHKVRLFLDAIEDVVELPDPYYGDSVGFELALDLAEQGCQALIKDVLSKP